MSAATAPTPPSSRWLFGPASNLLFGCGVACVAVFVALSLAGQQIEAAVPLASFLLISLLPTLVQASIAALSVGETDRTLAYLQDVARLAPNDRALRRRIAQVNDLRNHPDEPRP